jgi:hypothetical protein
VLHRGFGRRPSSAPHHSPNKIESIGKADGVFVMQGATAAPYRTTSNMCHVDGEFTVFLTLWVARPAACVGTRVYGSAVDGEVTMVQVQLHLDPQPDGKWMPWPRSASSLPP